MSRKVRIRLIDAMVVLGIAGYCWYGTTNGASKPAGPSTFAQQVNLDPLYHTAVQADGRLRSFESHAKTYIGGYVTGPREISGQSNGFTYLDLLFRPELYRDTDLIY